LAASCTFCSAVGPLVRAALRFCRSLRAASGSFSIIAAASSLNENATQDELPTSTASASAAAAGRGTRIALSHSTAGLSA